MMPPLGGSSMLSSLADEIPLSEKHEPVDGAGEDIVSPLFIDSSVPTASASLLLPVNVTHALTFAQLY